MPVTFSTMFSRFPSRNTYLSIIIMNPIHILILFPSSFSLSSLSTLAAIEREVIWPVHLYPQHKLGSSIGSPKSPEKWKHQLQCYKEKLRFLLWFWKLSKDLFATNAHLQDFLSLTWRQKETSVSNVIHLAVNLDHIRYVLWSKFVNLLIFIKMIISLCTNY